MANKHNNEKKKFGYLVRNDQMIPRHNHSNNNHFYQKKKRKKKKRKEQKGANSNMYGLIKRWRTQLKSSPQEQNQRGKNVPSQGN